MAAYLKSKKVATSSDYCLNEKTQSLSLPVRPAKLQLGPMAKTQLFLPSGTLTAFVSAWHCLPNDGQGKEFELNVKYCNYLSPPK